MTLTPSNKLESTLRALKRIIPQRVFTALQPTYHLLLARVGAIIYHHPSRKLFVVAVTGTKGKSTTTELVRTLFAAAGYKTASLSTIQFCIGTKCTPNKYKMTVPGRFALQQFLREAVDAGCTHAVVEMSSEGAKQFRHVGVDFDALIFTNLQPEHIESHGGMAQYAAAKLSLARALEASPKRPRYIVANMDDAYGKQFLQAVVEVRAPFSLADAEPYTVDDTSVRFLYRRGSLFSVPLPGLFNLRNILGALALGSAMGIPEEVLRKSLEHVPPVAGRAERVERGQAFTVVVDYAHTPDSLRALLETYRNADAARKLICIMGSTGGGRDQWKRPAMGQIADEICDSVYLTNEDPYDEDPTHIVATIAKGFSTQTPTVILNRREAIAAALAEAQKITEHGGEAVVLITGKGTDPYIMGPGGTKEAWSDKQVAEEELGLLLQDKKSAVL